MAFRLYFNDEDFAKIVAALQAAAVDQSIPAPQRNNITTILNAGISSYATAPFLDPADPRATKDPACRNVLVNTSRTLADLINVVNTYLTKRSYGQGVPSADTPGIDWNGGGEQL